MYASIPDVLRLLVVPVFAWAALQDVRTRRLPNRLWPPLYAFGLLLLLWDTARLWPLVGFEGRLFLIQVAISLLVVLPLGYAFWYVGAFGGADAKALIAIAILFPTFPTYIALNQVFPVVETALGVFSLTVLTNTVLIGVLYPLALAGSNLANGERSPVMFLARPVPTESLRERHGRLFENTEGFSRNGLDIDALRMYLRWRGITLADLRAEPDRFRDPASVDETFDPTDGGTHVGPATDGGEVPAEQDDVGGADGDGSTAVDGEEPTTADGKEPAAVGEAEPDRADDPWAAERFLATIDHGAYGTDPDTLREGLALVASEDTVWVSPGLPFVVPMFLGLVVSLVYGDVLFALMGAVGLV